MQTPDGVASNVDKIRKLFPNCVTETRDETTGQLTYAVDFDQLRQELSGEIVEGPKERYQLTWPGKRQAILTANAPIRKTLRPAREESVDFDTTQNLFIEGDNLDALKLLQETYLGKVKMIYIDPPYNTGKDFVYKDNFTENTQEYLERSGQKDEEGNRLQLNTDSNGRYHSDWLTMMYSRLKIARNLLREDGVIFISIDESEQANLKVACDDIMGSHNYVSTIIWQKKFSRANDATYFSTMHDSIVCYAKSSKIHSTNGWELNLLDRKDAIPKGYSNPDNDSRGVWTSVVLSARSGGPSLEYEITSPSGRKSSPPSGRYWSVSQDKFLELKNDNRIWFGKDGSGTPRLKTFLSEVQSGIRPNTIWFHQDYGHNQEGRQNLKKLFDGIGLFDSPKPIRLLEKIIHISNAQTNDIILDFFAGSGTTGHAVMKLNAEDGGKRKYICVQLPEVTDEKSEAHKAGYANIAEITKERLRRAGKKIKEKHPDWKGDTGFRVLKIDITSMRDVYYTPTETTQNELDGLVDNLKDDRSAEDLLFQVMLDMGVPLDLPIQLEQLEGVDVYTVANNDLVACFAKAVTEDLVKAIAKRNPDRVVFRDAAFTSDSAKINAEQVRKHFAPNSTLKVL